MCPQPEASGDPTCVSGIPYGDHPEPLDPGQPPRILLSSSISVSPCQQVHWVRQQSRGTSPPPGRDTDSEEEASDFDDDSGEEPYDQEYNMGYDEEMDYSDEDDEEDW